MSVLEILNARNIVKSTRGCGIRIIILKGLHAAVRASACDKSNVYSNKYKKAA
jgi:hypothetical protein